jgi:hypothetical protein
VVGVERKYVWCISRNETGRGTIRDLDLEETSPLLAKDARNGAPAGSDEELFYLNDFTAAVSSSLTSNTV